MTVARLRSLLDQGVRGDRILVLLPQRDRRGLYESPPTDTPQAGARPQVHTYYSLTTRLVRLFWPVAPADAANTVIRAVAKVVGERHRNEHMSDSFKLLR